MIRYTLHCDADHEFEAWFASGAAYEAQADRRQITCPHCGSVTVSKAIMAPHVAARPRRSERTAPPKQITKRLRKLRDALLKDSDDVGDRFAEEARKIHHEEAEPRSIHGSATDVEARALREEGVPFHPLPSFPEDQN